MTQETKKTEDLVQLKIIRTLLCGLHERDEGLSFALSTIDEKVENLERERS